MGRVVGSVPAQASSGLLLTTGRSEQFLKHVTSAEAMAFGRSMLERMQVDWAAAGYGDNERDELVEFLLRILKSLVIDPPRQRSEEQLRSFLHRWLAPAIRSATDRAAP